MQGTKTDLEVGFGEADITPPTGLAMAGSLDPRTNVGLGDPLMAKALLARDGDHTMTVVGLDLVGLPRQIADEAIAEASSRVDIGPESVMISCSHTHSGPYLQNRPHLPDVADAGYLASLPGLIADSIEEAMKTRRPATMHIGRSLVHHGLHHRRVLCKSDGNAVNT
jgi:neutral/alkaline ceramidase-like enzyme